MNTLNLVLATNALIGFGNGVDLAINKNWKSFIKFCIAVIAGTIMGFLGWFGLTPEFGFILGLNSSGFYKEVQLLSQIGRK